MPASSTTGPPANADAKRFGERRPQPPLWYAAEPRFARYQSGGYRHRTPTPPMRGKRR